MAAARILILVDLQADYLEAPGLEPAAAEVVDAAARLLTTARARRWTVVHVLTTLRRDDDRRMPHWKRSGLWRCVEGTRGHDPPAALAPRRGETIVHKTGWDGFASGRLERILHGAGASEVVVCGVHAHACVRQVMLGAHERGFAVTVAENAVGSDDPLHAAVTRRYVEARGIVYRQLADLLAD